MHKDLILTNPQTDALAFKISAITNGAFFLRDPESDFYSLLLVVHGNGVLQYDLKKEPFSDNTLMRFPIYQPFRLRAEKDFKGYLLQFDADFFWNHKYRTDLPSKNALFGQSGEPLTLLNEEEVSRLLFPLEQLQNEFNDDAIGQYELMVSYAQIFLISASRIIANNCRQEKIRDKYEPQLLRRLIGAIEKYYAAKHSPTEYGKLLNVSVKTLNRVTRSQVNKTVTQVIAGRIIAEAKRELYLSTRPVKEIAARLGFNDEAYFSRFFKHHTGTSPQHYRRTVNPNKNA
jgi:AraC-like DNA-binding protein